MRNHFLAGLMTSLEILARKTSGAWAVVSGLQAVQVNRNFLAGSLHLLR
ncbi:MAG: hypothetical protein MUP90_08255 [Gammaproteobacteria bacterium]|nr:hypothetical protein [Gammaproteobacteria bacterium]